MFDIIRGDNTGAFGASFLQINLYNPTQKEISKAVVQLGCISKTFENPVFPLKVNLNGCETSKLNFENDISLAVWDNKGRKITPKQSYSFYTQNERVCGKDNPLNDSNSSEGVGTEVQFDLTSEEIQAVFSINVAPAYTSELINDSGFVTYDAQNLVYYTKTDDMNALLAEKANQSDLENLNETVSNLNTTVSSNYNTLDNKIDTVNQELTGDIDTLDTKIDTVNETLQTNINTLENTVTNNYTTLENQISAEETNRINADDALSDRIDAVEARGRFLALWNAVAGLPESIPQITPYTYKTGDYYIVDEVGEVNYRPTGTEFVEGQPSTEIETEELTTDDVYYYDGAVWRLQVNHGKTVSFGNLTGQPSDNTALKQALDGKQPVGDYATTTELTEGLATKQDTLVSGTNIKTLNNESLLGSGNIDISSAEWGNITGALSNQTDLKNALDLKQNITDNNLVTTDKTVVGAVNELDANIKAGLATRADISLSNLDEQGEAKLGTQVILRRW